MVRLCFWDKAVAQVNKNPWNNTSNRVHLRGSGLAMYWQGPNEWRATASVGKSLGVSSSLLGGADAMQKPLGLSWPKLGAEPGVATVIFVYLQPYTLGFSPTGQVWQIC